MLGLYSFLEFAEKWIQQTAFNFCTSVYLKKKIKLIEKNLPKIPSEYVGLIFIVVTVGGDFTSVVLTFLAMVTLPKGKTNGLRFHPKTRFTY